MTFVILIVALILFIVQFSVLLFLARSFSKHFYRFWFLLTKSNLWAIRLTSFFLFPGTLLHELSHWLVAELCMVPTGKITLTPQVEEGNGIKLGSVALARTDPFRRTMIGIAPFIFGLGLITLITSRLPTNPLEFIDINQPVLLLATNYLLLTTIFLISNTMFSSPKDLDSAFVPAFLLVLISIAWWWFAWPMPEFFIHAFDQMLHKLNLVFAITIGINGIFLLLVKLLTRIFGKLLNRRLVSK